MKINLRFPIGLFALGMFFWATRDWGTLRWEIHLAAILVRYGVGKILMLVIAIGFGIDLGILAVRAIRFSRECEDHGV